MVHFPFVNDTSAVEIDFCVGSAFARQVERLFPEGSVDENV